MELEDQCSLNSTRTRREDTGGRASSETNSHQQFTFIKLILYRAPKVINRGPFFPAGRHCSGSGSGSVTPKQTTFDLHTEITQTTSLSPKGSRTLSKDCNYRTLLKFCNCLVELNGEWTNRNEIRMWIASVVTVLHPKVLFCSPRRPDGSFERF